MFYFLFYRFQYILAKWVGVSVVLNGTTVKVARFDEVYSSIIRSINQSVD